MKKITYLLLLSVALILVSFFACKKDPPTVVNGTVIDKNTGDPVEGVAIGYNLDHSNFQYEYKSVPTNEFGKFNFESDLHAYLFDLKKAGYLSKGGSSNFIFVKQEEINNLTIEMVPKDAFLKLVISNSTNQSDSIYIGIYSPLQKLEAPISNGVMLRKGYFLQGLGLDNELINLASNESVIIYWSLSQSTFLFDTAPYRDTVFIPKNQIAFDTISF